MQICEEKPKPRVSKQCWRFRWLTNCFFFISVNVVRKTPKYVFSRSTNF